MQHVMVIVPVDADVDEAQHVAHEDGDQRCQGGYAVPVRNLQLEHHDGDDDGYHAIAERLQPSLSHLSSPLLRVARNGSNDAFPRTTIEACMQRTSPIRMR